MIRQLKIPLRSRYKRIALYSIPVIFLSLFIIFDVNRSRQDPEDKIHRGWSKFGAMAVDEDWNEGTKDEAFKKFIDSTSNDTFQPFNPVKKPEAQPPRVFPVVERKETRDFEPLPALIGFEQPMQKELEKEEDGELVLQLPVGTIVYARLLMPVYSNDDRNNRSIYAELVKPLLMNGKTLMPRNTRIIGHISRIEKAKTRFQEEWEILFEGGERKILKARLQERDYELMTGFYGSFDGAPGLRMRALKIDAEPRVTKLEKLFDEVVKPLAIQRAQEEINSELRLPPLQRWPVDILETPRPEDLSEGREDEHYIPAGTEFYLWVL